MSGVEGDPLRRDEFDVQKQWPPGVIPPDAYAPEDTGQESGPDDVLGDAARWEPEE